MTPEEKERYSLAAFMLIAGYHKGAAHFWASIAQDKPLESHLGLGAVAFRSEDYSTAEDHFLAVLKADPDHYEARLALGYTYLEAGLHQEALDHFDIAAMDHPDRSSTFGARARAFSRMGDFQAAQPLFSKAVALEPLNYDLWLDYARCCGALKDANALVSAYNKALECDPRRPEAYLELSHVQILNGDFEMASRLFTLAWRDYHIRDPLLLIRAAQVEEKLGDHKLALFLIQEAAPHVQTEDPSFDWRTLWNEIFTGPEG